MTVDLKKQNKQECQRSMMEFLVTKPYEKNLDKLIQLGKAAGLRRDLSKMSFSRDLGYYFTDSRRTKISLASDFRIKWKYNISDQHKQRNTVNNAKPETKERKQQQMIKFRKETHLMYIFYLADVFTTSLPVQSCQERNQPWDSVYSHPDNTHHLYPGYWTSFDGRVCMRRTHFKNGKGETTNTKIYHKMTDLPAAICLELMAVVCKDLSVAQQTEAFVIVS